MLLRSLRVLIFLVLFLSFVFPPFPRPVSQVIPSHTILFFVYPGAPISRQQRGPVLAE